MPTSTSGVVVCREPPAAEAGRHVLSAGGNAFDAAIATAFAQAVVNPMACGIGGTAEVNLFDARSADHLLIRAFGGAGELATPDVYEVVGDTPRPGRWRVKDNANYIGYAAITVPTFVRVMAETHRLFGSLPWEDLLEPAIDLAVKGFEVWPQLAASWDMHAKGAFDWPSGKDTLTATEECAKVYLDEGEFLKAGFTLRQTDYGRTLEVIARKGADSFYSGEIGRAITDDFVSNGALITAEDLLRCRAHVSRPLRTAYKETVLHGSGPYRMQMFKVLEGIDLKGLGHNSGAYLDILARCFQAVHEDRARYMGDSAFEDVPVHHLISEARAAQIREDILSGRDIKDSEPGAIPVFSTTGAVAIDSQGNAVALKHSNGNSSGVVSPGLGFLYNNHMHNFNPRPGTRNSIAPGKEPHGAAGGPLIVTRGGSPLLALAHYSRAGTTSEVQIVLNMLEFQMDIQTAVEAPRIHAEYPKRTVFVDPDFPSRLIQDIEELGAQEVIVGKITPAVATAYRDPDSGGLAGGGDPRGAYGVAMT